LLYLRRIAGAGTLPEVAVSIGALLHPALLLGN